MTLTTKPNWLFPKNPGPFALAKTKTKWANQSSFEVLRTWWQRLQDERGERAVLRRAATVTEVMLSPAFHRLLRDLNAAGFGIGESRFPKLAAIAGLAARLKDIDAEDSLATTMGKPKTGEKSAVSELRMRRVLACNDVEELYTLLRRVLSPLNDRANLADLAAVIWRWWPMDEKRPNDSRRQMAYDYYTAAPLKN